MSRRATGPTVDGYTTPMSPGQTFEYTVPDIFGRPWAQIWERYHEKGMERPKENAAGSVFERPDLSRTRMTTHNHLTYRVPAVLAGALCVFVGIAQAHHSFAMYDSNKTYVITGVVVRVDPNPNHLQIFFAPLNDARTQVIRDSKNEPVVWALEMDSAGAAARDGITVNNFPRGTILSVGLHPLRNGLPAGGRGKSGLFKCPDDTPPAPGKHCDSVKGSTSHGHGALPKPTGPVPMPTTR